MWEVERSEVQRHTATWSQLCRVTGCICMVFASTLEELTTQLWWRAVKSPGVCADTLPCFAFALTKTFNWVTTLMSVLCLPFHPVLSTADYFCGRQQWMGVNEPGLTQITLLQIPFRSPSRGPRLLGDYCPFTWYATRTGHIELTIRCLMKVAVFPHACTYPWE